MLSAKEIREVKFSKSVGGYKQEEVDILLDRVEADLEQYDRTVQEMQNRINSLNQEIENYKNSQNSIQNVLLSAQKLADQIVEEARDKGNAIIREAETKVSGIQANAEALAADYQRESDERRSQIEGELAVMLRQHDEKAKCIDRASADAVARQQMLFDRLKIEVAEFKADITNRYKEHLAVLQKLPDEVPMDPQYAAQVVSAAIDATPNVADFVAKPEETVPETVPVAEPEEQNGFTVQSDSLSAE